MKKHSILLKIILLSITVLSCKNDNVLLNYLNDNKYDFYLHLINDEITKELINIANENNSIIDNKYTLYENFIKNDNDILIGYCKINSLMDETLLGYIVIQKDGINIGQYITKIEKIKDEIGFIISCHLNSEGSQILYEMTKNNIGKGLAIVFKNKVVSFPTIRVPVQNFINIWVDE